MKLAIFGSGKIVQEFLAITKDLPEIQLKAIMGTKRSQEKRRKFKQNTKSKPPTRILMSV